MMLHLGPARNLLASVVVAGLVVLNVQPARAIVLDMIDDFQAGTLAGWQIGGAYEGPQIISDAGPMGIGDYALKMDSSNDFVHSPRLLVYNTAQWTGDWIAAGIERISFDVRNPSSLDLTMRIAVAGAGGFFNGGTGDTYVSDGIEVPNDNAWHNITFDVTATGLNPVNGSNADAALTEVGAIRILHNPLEATRGDLVTAGFYLDNIHALAADAGLAGDYNGDGSVDAADYTLWRDTLGQTGTGLAADGTGPGGTPDGVVDNLDYNFWKTNFGNTSGGGHHHGLGVAAAVPEPTALVVFLLGIAAMAALVRRKELAN